MSKQPDWKGLQSALCKLDPEGESGFEGFVRDLFQAEMGCLFYLARKGDQPTGDVHSPEAGVALEAKRYNRASVSEDKIEGEIDRAIRGDVQLDLFVVVATRQLGQLAARLAKKSEETGVDILPLFLGGGLSEFGALCVNHWHVVQKFVSKFAPSWQHWAEARAAESDTQAALGRLRQRLSGIGTWNFVTKATNQRISQRLRGDGGAVMHNCIDLGNAVSRPAIALKLHDWWSGKEGIVVIEGEEGMGKTWVAGAFAEDLTRSGDQVVFWLDSLSWCREETIEGLILTALKSIFVGDNSMRERIKRKVFFRWKQPVLMVLDGANERNAWESVERLLHDYDLHRGSFEPRVRILFTSRPMASMRYHLWSDCESISVGPFDDEEFKGALNRFAAGVSAFEFTSAVREFARIPRYFRLCVKLRETLSSLQHVNKQLLLWADLRQKLEMGDPQIVDLKNEFSGTPDEILAHLARAVGWPKTTDCTTDELLRAFPNFLEAREDLMQQRVVLNGDLETTTVNSDHVVLGWALILRKLARRFANETQVQLAERLFRELEPAAANDDKVRAIQVALLLTFLEEDPCFTNASNARATLFSMWVSHHNAIVFGLDVDFFVERDLTAYLKAVETLFREHLPGNLDTSLISPLARLWRDKTNRVEVLQSALIKWLRLIYPGGHEGSKERNEAPPDCFVVAESAEQLRLSYSAIGIISFRPEIDLLPVLLDCYSTDSFCYVDRDAGSSIFRSPIKNAAEQIGVLLRWGYTEKIMPEIYAIRLSNSADQRICEDISWFARLLRLVELPSEIAAAEDIYSGGPKPPVEQVSELVSWLRMGEERNRDFLGLGDLGTYAVRSDAPSFETKDVQALTNFTRELLEKSIAELSFPGSWENHKISNILPYLARYAPAEFHRTCILLWKHAIQSLQGANALRSFFFLDEFMPGEDPGGELVEALLHQPLPSNDDSDLDLVQLTELVLLHGNAKQVFDWLEQIEHGVLRRGEFPIVSIEPLPDAFRTLAPLGLADKAKQKFKLVYEEFQKQPKNEKARVATRFWLQVYAYTAPSTKDVGEWALAVAEATADDKHFRFPLLLILSRCTDENVFWRAIQHPIFRDEQIGFNCWRWAREAFDTSSLTFDTMKSRFSLSVIGILMYVNKLDKELCKWGRFVASVALRSIKSEQDTVTPRVDLEFDVDNQRKITGIGFLAPSGGRTRSFDISSPVWGVDRQSSSPPMTQQDMDRAGDEFCGDLAAFQQSARREFFNFNAAGALLRWSELEPDVFCSFAEEFLSMLEKSGGDVLEMHFFAKTVAIGLLRLKPSRAVEFCEVRRSGIRINVLTLNGALRWETRELWSADLNGREEVVASRRQMLVEALDDENLFWQVAAALVNKNSEPIRKFAEEWLTAPVARERALGVTLMGFLGDQQSLSMLDKARNSDASFWVSKQANWAWDVCMQEIVCRQRYRHVVQSRSLPDLAVGLGELRMALTPMVWSWRKTVESDSDPVYLNARMKGYLQMFWYHWSNTSSKKENITVLGRKLREYCRGEGLRDGITSRQNPWWKIDD